MKIQYKDNLLRCATLLFFLILNSSANAGTGPQGLTLQGTILTASSLPEESASVVFTVQIKSPGAEGCLLFQENQTLNMTSSGGAFSFVLGAGTRSGSGFALTSTLPQVFTNAAVAIGSLTCAIGNSYTPTASDSRKVILTFDDGSGPQTVTQALNVESVPYAIYADYLQDKQPTDFVQVNTLTAAVSQANLESIFASAANVTKLSNLIAGTSTQYITSGTSTFAGDVTLNGAGTGLAVTSATASTSSSTGAEVVSGGLGVAGAIYTGGAINAGGAIAATGAISSSSTISSSTSITTPIIYGSSSASGNLTLDSTSDATKGYVLLAPSGGNVGIGTTSPASPLVVSKDFNDPTPLQYYYGTITNVNRNVATAGIADGVYGNRTVVNRTGASTTMAAVAGGDSISVSQTGATGGSPYTYGQTIQVTGDTGGTSTATGSYIYATGADTNYGLRATIFAPVGTTGTALAVDAGTGGGTVYAATLINGNVGAGTSTVYFGTGAYEDRGQTINLGSMHLNNVGFVLYDPSRLITITGNLFVDGNLSFDGGAGITGGTINVQGNTNFITNYGGNNPQIIFLGNGAQTITVGASGHASSGNWTVNKTGGSLTLASNTVIDGVAQTLTITAGSMNMSGKNLTIGSNLSLNANTLTKSAGVLTVNGSVVGTGSLYGGTVAP